MEMIPDFVRPIAEGCAALIELLGVLLIAGLSVQALVLALVERARGASSARVYQQLRHRLGRGILLGLELLVAADIIHTVAVELSWSTVGVLAVIVLIRTFLSFTIDVELDGRWPWQQAHPVARSATDRG